MPLPSGFPTNVPKTSTLHNTALSVATGCIKMNPTEETKVLPVNDLLSLIGSQYLASTLESINPS